MVNDWFDFIQETPWIPFVPDEFSLGSWSL